MKAILLPILATLVFSTSAPAQSTITISPGGISVGEREHSPGWYRSHGYRFYGDHWYSSDEWKEREWRHRQRERDADYRYHRYHHHHHDDEDEGD
jgi:hypothetical protein